MRFERMALLLCAFAAAVPVSADAVKPNGNTLYLEAERFDNIGGWTVDAQFRQQMGSTYLLAAGIGTPVADAVTKVRLPQAGEYHLWVRCKDWDKTSPGAFEVSINNHASAVTFGTQKKDWAWIEGGAFSLPAGESTIRLHDLTGYYGRCDAILLTTDAAYTPPADVEGTKALREALLGRPKLETRHFDFVVIGGGYGGVCAAIQAARLGLKTALVQNRPVLGGNASPEINVGPGGASPSPQRFRETGIPEEIAEGCVHPGCKDHNDAILLLLKDLRNLSLFLNTEGVRVEMADPRHIAAVEAEQVITGQRILFRAPLFADCTGDGVIADAAGCRSRWGEESRAEFGESYAPEKPSRETMGTSLLHRSKRMDTPQPYTPPAFAKKFTAEYFNARHGNLLQGQWWIEYGGQLDTIKDAEQIRDELLRAVFGAFDWAKNYDPETRDKAQNYKLVWVPTVGGKRESRRFIGDYTLTQQDVEGGRIFPDRVAVGGWPVDVHYSAGIYGKEIPPYYSHPLKQVYTIPYRILYPQELDNLLLAGRHVSVTHIALGSTRLMQTIGTMGQAIGAAALLCRKYGVSTHDVYPNHIGELQEILLKWDAYIPETPDDDPGNLCRGAKVTASSSIGDALAQLGADPKPNKEAPCTMDRGQTLVMAKPGVKKLSLLLSAKAATTAVLHIEREPKDGGNPTPLWTVNTPITPGSSFNWVDFELPQELSVGEPYFVWLGANPDLRWQICDMAVGERVWGKPGAWTQGEGLYAMRPYGAPVRLSNVGPTAAVDGLSVPLKGEGHQWRSDPSKGLPQWLEVDFGKPVRLNTVYLTFDTNIYGRFPVATPGGEITATHYRVLYHSGKKWKTAFEEKNNWRRFRRHTFHMVTTDKIRLELLAAKNGNEARVYEIRAYNE